MFINKGHSPRILLSLMIVFISLSLVTGEQPSGAEFDPDYPIGTPRLYGGTGYVTEVTDGDGWHTDGGAIGFGQQCTDVAACTNAGVYNLYHPGEDWNYESGSAGQPVYAIANGTVFDTRAALFDDKSGYGSGIVIEHTLPSGGKIYSVYEHIDTSLSKGDTVYQGQSIGSIAAITMLTPHLHFEIRTTLNKSDWYPNDEGGRAYYLSKEKIYADGLIDPSDFIDSHRSLQAYAAVAGTSIGAPVTLTLYVHDGDMDGPVIPDAQVTGQDGSGNSFAQTTDSNGYVTIAGDAGSWSFSASASGYETNNWDQDITESRTKHAFLQIEQSQDFGGVEFPNGMASFADHVVSYNLCNGVSSPHNNPNNALGPPDYNGVASASYVSLGNTKNASDCGSLVLEFIDNALVDVPGNDLYIFEVGPSVEATEVFISTDGQEWIDLGKIEGSSWGLDIHDNASLGQEFHFVKLCDYPDGKTSPSPTPGPDIDALGAIGSVI